MNQLYMLRRHLVLAIAIVTSALFPLIAQAAPITYRLLPGSTITPVFGLTPIGPTEALTGTFQWVGPDNNQGFDAVALFFSSPSFSIGLNQTALNDLETFVSPLSSVTIFAEIVDLMGLNAAVGELVGNGTYLGPSTAPNFLSYPLLRIAPLGPGGVFVADLSFSASPVPEPPGWILSATALALAAGLGAARKSSMRPFTS